MAGHWLLLVTMAALLVLVTLTESQVQVGNSAPRYGSRSGFTKQLASKRFSNRQADANGRRPQTFYRNSPDNYLMSDNSRSRPDNFHFLWNRDPTSDFWWQGPNVCKKETEEHFNKTDRWNVSMRHFRTNSQICDESETFYKCQIVQENLTGRLELTVFYQCCSGYTRRNGDFGCPTKTNLTNVLESVEQLGLTDFVRAVKLLNLTENLQTKDLTLFAPVNAALTLDTVLLGPQTAGVMLKDEPDWLTGPDQATDNAVTLLRSVVLNHVLAGSVRTRDMTDEQLLHTWAGGDASIRINHFSRPEKLLTANCIPITSRDHQATNGVIHMVDTVLQPITESLLDIVRSREELGTFEKVLAAANYQSKVDQGGHLTILAPTNAAFDKLEKRLQDQLLAGDTECLEKVLKNHILPHVICSVAIQGVARTANQLNRYINISRTADNKLFVNGAQIIQPDVMATNGVLHVIDDVLVPSEALGVLDLMKRKGFTEFVRLVEKSGMSKLLETSSNITVFVPTNEAIQKLPPAVRTKLHEESGLLKDVVAFHISPEIHECRQIRDNQLLPSLAGPNIRFNIYSMFPHKNHGVTTSQCVPVAAMNMVAHNGQINVIRSVMTPPKGNILDVLSLDKRFSTFLSLVKKSGLADELQLPGPFTVLSPSAEAFEKLGHRFLELLGKDLTKLKRFILCHILEGNLCCSGIVERHRLDRRQVKTLSGNILKLSRDQHNRPRIMDAAVTKCDQTATNGNVLEIDRAFVHESVRQRFRFSPQWNRFEP